MGSRKERERKKSGNAAGVDQADRQGDRAEQAAEGAIVRLDLVLRHAQHARFPLVSAERARDLPHPPAVIAGAAAGSADDQYIMTSYYRDGLTGLPEMGLVGDQLWSQSGLRPSDMQTAIFYDHFTPYVLMQLEELGFCGRGEAKDFIAGGAIELGGKLPINTHGGQLGEAYIHGMNGIAEGVRQIRGTSVNQVDSVENVLVTAGTGVPTSGLVLTR